MIKKIIGHIGVDAGMCLVGDPCYVIDADLGRMEWAEFLATYIPFEDGKGGFNAHWQVPFPPNLPAGRRPEAIHRAVVVSTGYGDGLYPVEANINKDGRITRVTVKFC